VICLQWYILVLTLRLAVYTLFGKTRSNLGKNFLHPQNYALPYTYGCRRRLHFSQDEQAHLSKMSSSSAL